VEQDPVLKKTIALHRRLQVAQHLAAGKRLLEKRQPEQACRQLAVAYVFDAQPEILLEVARACRQAELDMEAFALYERLEKERPQFPERDELEEELKALDAKLDDPELDLAQTLRDHMDLAKKGFQAGQYAAASQQYALSYAIKPLPRLLFNVAQAYRRAGNPDESYILYTRFLEEEPLTPLKKEALGYLKELGVLAFRPPIYRRAWFWGVVGTAAAVVAATSVGLAVALQPKPPASDGGTFVLTFPGLLRSR
jgi:tetratricopeptide (TPR) repeat protein